MDCHCDPRGHFLWSNVLFQVFAYVFFHDICEWWVSLSSQKTSYTVYHRLSSQTVSSSLVSWTNASLFLLLQNSERFSIETPWNLFECFLNVQVDCFFWCATRSSLWNAMQTVSFPVICGQQKPNLFPIFQNAAESFLYLDIFFHISWDSFLIQILYYSPLDIKMSPNLLKSCFQKCSKWDIILHRQLHIWVMRRFEF